MPKENKSNDYICNHIKQRRLLTTFHRHKNHFTRIVTVTIEKSIFGNLSAGMPKTFFFLVRRAQINAKCALCVMRSVLRYSSVVHF